MWKLGKKGPITQDTGERYFGTLEKTRHDSWNRSCVICHGISPSRIVCACARRTRLVQASQPRTQKCVYTSVSPALGVMELVAQRDAATLLSVLQRHVRPGTIVWRDMWAAYNNVQHLPPVTQHQTMNHSVCRVCQVSHWGHTSSRIGTG